jgi:Zn-dependent peptidase ImmA (M78 family)
MRFRNPRCRGGVALTRELLARRIRDALSRSRLTQRDLAAAVGMDPTALSKALAGQRGFGSLEVAVIAEHLGVPTTLLLADDGSDPSSVALAARVPADATPASVTVEKAVRLAEETRDLDVLLTDLGYPTSPPRSFPPMPTTPDPVRQGEALADAVRAQAGLADGNLPSEPDGLAGWLEHEFGLDVRIAPLGSGLDGLALRAGHFRLAVITSSVTATRQRFTLAHELCHLAAGDAQITVDRNVFEHRTLEELRANAFAAAFLMPAAAMHRTTADREIDETLVADLLGMFRVSLDALAFRLHNLGVVNASGRDRIRAMWSARIALRPGRDEDLQSHDGRRAPNPLLRRAMKAFASGDLSIRPLVALLDTDPEQLLDELEPPRFTPPPDDVEQQAYAL